MTVNMIPGCRVAPAVLVIALAFAGMDASAQSPKPSTLPGQPPPTLPGTPKPTLPTAPPVVEPLAPPKPPKVSMPPKIDAPIRPRIAGVSVSALPHPQIVAPKGSVPAPRQDAMVRMEFADIEDAESYVVEQVTSNCGWRQAPSLIFADNDQRDRPGFGEIQRQGIFLTGGACRMYVHLRMKRAGRPPEPVITIESSPFTLAPAKTVRIEATSSFAQRLGLHYAAGSVGTCSGESRGTLPPFPVHGVGLVSTPAGDMRIVARSGPVGTRCHWRTELLELPPGVYLTRFHSRASASDGRRTPAGNRATCGVSGEIMSDQPGPPNGYDFTRGFAPFPVSDVDGQSLQSLQGGNMPQQVGGFPPIVTPDGVILLDEFQNKTRYRSLIAPMHLRLRCGITATNDHSGQLVVEALEFSVPDNVRFP